MSAQMPRVSAEWLRIREYADAQARSQELVDRVRQHLADADKVTIHDLGCGTGSMGRWLAPLLGGRQHWVMCDRDADLLDHAAYGLGAGSGEVTVEIRCRDIADLTAGDLAGAGLVTASALLDLLTADEVDRVAAACAGAGCPALLTLSVSGHVDLDPVDPLDGQIMAAFNAHQRRTIDSRRLLGPDAVEVTRSAFAARGIATTVRASDWRLDGDRRDLLARWFQGWLGAACEQLPQLARAATAYARERLDQVEQGRLRVVVRHHDLLAGCG